MKIILAFCASILSFSMPAFADNFRCPNDNIVSTGDSISVISAKCDPPTNSFKRDEPIEVGITRADGSASTRIAYIEVQEWTYKQVGSFLHTLIFRNGILTEVRTGGFAE